MTPADATPALRVLVVEDSKDDAELMARALRKAGHDPQWDRVEDRAGLVAATRRPWDVILSDHSLPSLSSVAVLGILRDARILTPVIIVSGKIGEEAVVAAMQQGADGFVPKDRLGLLPAAVDRAIRNASERSTRQRAEDERDGFFHLSLDLIAIIDDDQRFKVHNPSWERTLGFTSDELRSRPFLDFVVPEDRKRMEVHLRGLATSGAATRIECRFRCADGSTRWLLWGSARSESARVTYAVAHDITESKRAEAALVSSRVARPLVKRIIRSIFEATGSDASLLLHLGQELASEGEAGDLDSMCRAYEEMGLGSLAVEDLQRQRYIFRGSDLFERAPGSRATTCHLALGFLSGIVSRTNDGRPAPGAEIACESRGDPACRFMIQVKDVPRPEPTAAPVLPIGTPT